jgi:phage terminase Nu1 subunit (DNA packaging protein)
VLRREARGVFDVADSIAAYVAHRESVVAAEHGTGDYGRARAELYLERARAARLKREELEGTLAPLSVTRAAWTSILTMVRTRVLAIPNKLAPRLVGLKTAGEALALVRGEIYEALEELSKSSAWLARRKGEPG